MATGTPRTAWPDAQEPVIGATDFQISYDGKEPEERILRVPPTTPRRVWSPAPRSEPNALYFGDNPGLLSHLRLDLRGAVRLICRLLGRRSGKPVPRRWGLAVPDGCGFLVSPSEANRCLRVGTSGSCSA